MGSISLQIPQSGQANSTEDVKVANDLTTLQTWANGNVDTNNLSPTAAITAAQLAAGVRLAWRSVSSIATASNGDLINATVGGYTIGLPSPTANAIVGVWAGTNITAPVTIAGNGNNIFGLGPLTTGVGSIQLGTVGAFALFQSDGTNWIIVGGQQDTGWVALTLATNIGAGTSYTPSARLQGDTVRLKGAPVNNTGGTYSSGSPWATIPSGLRPGVMLWLPAAGFPAGATNITTGGVISINAGNGNGGPIYLDGLTYSIS